MNKIQFTKGPRIGLYVVTLAALISVPIITLQGNTADITAERPKDNLFIIPEIPDTLNFAGEPVPLDNFDTFESFDRELITNTYYHSQTIRMLKLAPRIFETIEPILAKNGIPDDFKYLAMAESALNPKVLSPAGAAGIWQFMKTTGREYGLQIDTEIDERYHLEKATQAACKFLNSAYKKYGSWTLTAASYNAGQAGIDRFISRQKQDNYYDLLMSEETMRYVFRILAIKAIINDPVKYGYDWNPKMAYKPIKYKEDTIKGRIESWADYARLNNTNYKLLKELNPWLRETSLTNKEQKSYVIKLPIERDLKNKR